MDLNVAGSGIQQPMTNCGFCAVRRRRRRCRRSGVQYIRITDTDNIQIPMQREAKKEGGREGGRGQAKRPSTGQAPLHRSSQLASQASQAKPSPDGRRPCGPCLHVAKWWKLPRVKPLGTDRPEATCRRRLLLLVCRSPPDTRPTPARRPPDARRRPHASATGNFVGN